MKTLNDRLVERGESLRVSILLDAMRSSRGVENSRTMLLPMLRDHPHCKVSYRLCSYKLYHMQPQLYLYPTFDLEPSCFNYTSYELFKRRCIYQITRFTSRIPHVEHRAHFGNVFRCSKSGGLLIFLCKRLIHRETGVIHREQQIDVIHTE